MPGSAISAVEVTPVCAWGLWLLVDGEEHLSAFDSFPWFRSATIQELTEPTRPAPDHVRWPALDVDLGLDSIRHPDACPWLAKARSMVAEGPGGDAAGLSRAAVAVDHASRPGPPSSSLGWRPRGSIRGLFSPCSDRVLLLIL
ncbi:MAG: DUF2442 domain-containing protein [bacterium]|jgi:hypothetical protein|nr:DUF2442 domain-containing protein [bacterium]